MKYKELKQRLIIESGIIAGSLAVMAGVAFFLSGFSDDYQKSGEDLKNKVQTITASTNALSAKYGNVKQNGTLLQNIMELQSHDRFSISPQTAKARFNHLREQYYLSDLHLSLSPITEMQDANYRRESYVVVSSEASVTFGGLSDEYAYSLINAIQQDLPGSSEIIGLTLTHQSNVTNDILRTISATGTAQMMKAELKFMWFGIKPVESSDNANAPKKP